VEFIHAASEFSLFVSAFFLCCHPCQVRLGERQGQPIQSEQSLGGVLGLPSV